MSKFYIRIIVVIIGIVGCFFVFQKMYSGKVEDIVSEDSIDVPTVPSLDIITHIVAEDETFADVVSDFGIGYTQMLDILDVASSTYDFTRIKLGQPLKIARNAEKEIVYLEYEKNKDTFVRVHFEGIDYRVESGAIAYDVEIVHKRASIETSLYIDGLTTDIPEEIIMQFADVFAWSIDFAVQVHAGDSFEIVYEKRTRNGVDAGTGNVLAGKFVNNGREYSAYLFHDADGDLAYYSADGESLQKQFLRAPLNYRQITSGYTYARFDPIWGNNAPHLAIDYAAPIGTPVMAVGDGTIVFAGWSSIGFGNFISLRHNDLYTTEYAHLNGFAQGIKNGTHVVQGQVIGYVGSTGHSTGPHLHYQIKYNGKLVNPLEIDLPAGDPVVDENFADFERRKEELDRYF